MSEELLSSGLVDIVLALNVELRKYSKRPVHAVFSALKLVERERTMTINVKAGQETL